MLVLSRKPGQALVIAGEITITVLEMGRGRVQLGISAPAELPIHRQEIHDRIVREEQLAAECELAM